MKQRSYKVFRGMARRYTATDSSLPFDHADAWEALTSTLIPLVLHSDGITRVETRKVHSAYAIPDRPQVTVVLCLYGTKPKRLHLAVHTDDWLVWEERVNAIGDPAALPRLRYSGHR